MLVFRDKTGVVKLAEIVIFFGLKSLYSSGWESYIFRVEKLIFFGLEKLYFPG